MTKHLIKSVKLPTLYTIINSGVFLKQKEKAD